MAKKAFFMMRLNDHIQYLKKIDGRLKGDGDFKGTTHQDCKLGKWLYSEEAMQEMSTLENAKAKQVFDKLLELHENFHVQGQKALEKKQLGDEASAQVLFTELHKLSAILTNQLLELDGMT